MCISILLVCSTDFARIIEYYTTIVVNILLRLDQFINDFVFASKINLNHLQFGS